MESIQQAYDLIQLMATVGGLVVVTSLGFAALQLVADRASDSSDTVEGLDSSVQF